MLTKDDIERYLEQLADGLKREGLTGEIILCGGAVMALAYDARPTTKDIDALFAPAAQLRRIAADIARREGLNDDWLNDGAKAFLDTSRMSCITVRQFDNLTVKMPDAAGMLALKLTSAREDSKDMDDAIVLMKALTIQNEEQLLAILEKNIHPSRLTPLSRYFAMEAFGRYQLELTSKASHENS
jgi:hypothetical protein